MADYGFISQPQTNNSFQKLGEIVNTARGITELQKARATQEADIFQRKAESERAGIETGVARDTAAPRVASAAELAKQAELKTNLEKFKLSGEYAQRSRDISQQFVSDPDFVSGNSEAMVPKIAQARQMMIDSGVPPAVAEAQSAMLMSQAVTNPRGVRQILLNSIQAGVGSAGQATNIQDRGINVTNNNQSSTVSTNPLGTTPPGQPIPGTPQTAQVPVASQQTVDYNPVTQSPTVTTKSPQGVVTGVTPAPTGGGVPQLAPGQPEDIKLLAPIRASVNAAAAKVPEARFNNSQIIKLVDETDTGRRAELVRTLKGPLAGLPWETQGATKFDQLGHFIALEAANNAQAMGAGTDAARTLAEQKTASTGWTPQAIKSAVKINDALATGLQNYNKGMEAAIQKNGGNVLSVRPFQNAWSAAFDPNVYRYANALESGDKAEVTKILGPEGSPARKAKAAELARKSATLYRLSTEGQ